MPADITAEIIYWAGAAGVFAMLYEWAKDGRNFPVLGKGDNLYQYLDVADLCDAIWLCATLPRERVNDTFNIGAAIFGTPKSDFQAVLARLSQLDPASNYFRSIDGLECLEHQGARL